MKAYDLTVEYSFDEGNVEVRFFLSLLNFAASML
jgi:hypothetical protein